MSYEPTPDPCEVNWDVKGQGRKWNGEEVRARYDLTPGKLELIGGKLLWTDEDRLLLLGLLLENCGAEAAARIGDPEMWRRAVQLLDDSESTCRHEVEAAHRMRKRAVQYQQLAPELLPQFLERWVMPDYREYDGAVWLSRAEVVAAWQAEAARGKEASYNYPTFRITTETLAPVGESATGIARWTTERSVWEKQDDGKKRLVGSETEVSRWREEWRRLPEGWRLALSERIEGPTIFRQGPESETNADAS